MSVSAISVLMSVLFPTPAWPRRQMGNKRPLCLSSSSTWDASLSNSSKTGGVSVFWKTGRTRFLNQLTTRLECEFESDIFLTTKAVDNSCADLTNFEDLHHLIAKMIDHL